MGEITTCRRCGVAGHDPHVAGHYACIQALLGEVERLTRELADYRHRAAACPACVYQTRLLARAEKAETLLSEEREAHRLAVVEWNTEKVRADALRQAAGRVCHEHACRGPDLAIEVNDLSALCKGVTTPRELELATLRAEVERLTRENADARQAGYEDGMHAERMRLLGIVEEKVDAIDWKARAEKAEAVRDAALEVLRCLSAMPCRCHECWTSRGQHDPDGRCIVECLEDAQWDRFHGRAALTEPEGG